MNGQDIMFSLNNGTNWVNINSNISTFKYCLNANNDLLFAGTHYGLYFSSNNGNQWINMGPDTLTDISCIYINNSKIFAGTDLGFFTTTNNGLNWNNYPIIWTRNMIRCSIVISNTNILYGTKSIDAPGSTWVSTNNGTNWIRTSNDCSFLVSNNNYCFSSDNSLLISSNSGINWPQEQFAYTTFPMPLTIYGNNLLLGHNQNILLSVDNGNNWADISIGLPNDYIASLSFNDNFLFAGIENQGLWRRPITEVIAVTQISTLIPTHFSLSQNYPNPFNPSTKIKFDISTSFPPLKVEDSPWRGAKGMIVKLLIFDILGREVTTLVNEQLNPGSYEIEWDAGNNASGVYYYKLETEGFSETRKMLLIK